MKILLINQNFHPDISATSQYLTDLSQALVKNGHNVSVLCSSRSYLNNKKLYKKNEQFEDISIKRVWSFAFERDYKGKRILEAFFNNIIFTLYYLFMRHHDRVVVLTSPPLLHWFIGIAHFLKRDSLYLWTMDINPEQAIEVGWIKKGSFLARCLRTINTYLLTLYKKIIVLDEFMANHFKNHKILSNRVEVINLWPTIEEKSSQNGKTSEIRSFKTELGIENKTIIMYSGNHSICHPLATLLQTTLLMKDDKEYLFLFAGGGARKGEVTKFKSKHNLDNILQIGYQEQSDLHRLLNTGDIHIVSMGENYVGLVHPSKIYNILALKKPIIYIGPQQSGIKNILLKYSNSYFCEHKDSDSVRKAIVQISKSDITNISDENDYSIDSLVSSIVDFDEYR